MEGEQKLVWGFEEGAYEVGVKIVKYSRMEKDQGMKRIE